MVLMKRLKNNQFVSNPYKIFAKRCQVFSYPHCYPQYLWKTYLMKYCANARKPLTISVDNPYFIQYSKIAGRLRELKNLTSSALNPAITAANFRYNHCSILLVYFCDRYVFSS